MPDRHAGPVIRRADRARFPTSYHHHAASVAPPAVPSPPPPPPLPNTSLRTRSAGLRGDRAAPDNADLGITTNAPAREEEEGGAVGRARSVRDGEQSGPEQGPLSTIKTLRPRLRGAGSSSRTRNAS
ncbi:hypothetical protein GGF50DRAFT_122036 [Schizophyllum commune]